jgi:CO/xanthine dehydrogenase Mo-binding subunit
METHSAVAAIEHGKVTVWASTQTPFPLRSQVAQALMLPPEQVRVVTPIVGGGFGGKSAGRQAIEAARLARVAGVPVRVVWSREEEFFFDTFRPAAVITIRAGIDADTKLTHWDYVIGAGERGSRHPPFAPPDPGTGRWNANSRPAPVRHRPVARPGQQQRVRARIAHRHARRPRRVDPVAFRLANLSDARMARVLRAAATQFGWTPKPAPSGRGVGVALGMDAGTYVASMAEVKVDRATGRVQVTRVVCAQDMGVLVNPDGARQQAEGCITMGLGYCLTEEIRFRNGQVLDGNFDTYGLPRFSWLPKIEVVILDSPTCPRKAGANRPSSRWRGRRQRGLDAVGARVGSCR